MKDAIETKGCSCGRCATEGKGPCQMPKDRDIPFEHERQKGQIYEKRNNKSNHPGKIHPTDQEKNKGPRF